MLPTSISCALSTRSRTSPPPLDGAGSITPRACVWRSSAETAIDWSVRRVTCEASGRDFGHLPDEPVGRDDRIVQRDPVVRARGHQELLVVRCRRLGDDARRDRREVLGEAGPVDERERLAEALVLLRRRLVEDELVAQGLQLRLQRVSLGLRVGEVGDVAVGVLERPCDPLARHLERRQDCQPELLRAVERPLVVLAQIDGQEGERDDDEDAGDEASRHDALRSVRGARRARKRAQPGDPCCSLPWHG